MAVLAGIDEAGYGPTLGPLVVTGVAFRVPEDRLDSCLWETLRESCAPTRERGGHRLTIADSKKLYSSRGSMAPLERAALVMLAVGGHRPTTWRSLLDLLTPHAARELEQYPWYAGTDVPLPLCDDVGDISTRANAVRVDCAAHSVDLLGVHSEVLHEGHFNRLVRNTRNKAVVMLGLALRVVDRILRAAPRQRVRVCVDRLGGRSYYRESLTTAFPEFELQILEESPARSSYRLWHRSSTGETHGLQTRTTLCGPRVCDIEFVTRGEVHHYPVALASVFSKYLRELHMHLFNRYWTAQQAGLRPTAGYFADARRWLREASQTLDRLKIDRGMLMREK